WPTATTRSPARARPVSRPRTACGLWTAAVSSTSVQPCTAPVAAMPASAVPAARAIRRWRAFIAATRRASADAGASQGVGGPLAVRQRLGLAHATGFGDEAGQRVDARDQVVVAEHVGVG